MKTGPPNRHAPGGAGARVETRRKHCSAIVQLPPQKSNPPDGILGYRRPRTPGEVLHAIANALRREARVSDERRVPVPNDVLRDIADWGVRGCVPST
jgi:hypothetical protein